MLDALVYIVAIDWSLALLVAAAFVFLLGAIIGVVFPIWGGATAGNDEIPGMGIMVGGHLAAVPLALFVLVWIARGLLWVVRWIVCPC